MNDQLYRHPADRVIAGVAGGLATWLAIDPSLVRVAWVLLAIFSGGLFVIVYIVMVFVVPLPPPGWIPRPRGHGGAGASAGPEWQQGSSWPSEPPTAWPAQPAQPAWTAPRPGNAGIVTGVVLVVLGVWFLIDQYVRIDWDFIWPVVIMVAGGGLIAAALMRSRSG